MSFVLFADSFTRYKQATFSDPDLFENFSARYTSIGGGNGAIASDGRSGQCLTLPFANSAAKTLPHSTRWVTGFAFRLNATPVGNDAIYSIQNNTNSLAVLTQDLDGTISFKAGSSGGAIGVSTRALDVDRWYYIEVDVTFGGTTPITCTAEVRINGHVEISGTANTGVNATSNLSQDSTGNYHVFSGTTGAAGSGSCSFDDLYIKNEAGYYGDIRIIALFPDGDGATLDWSPSTGAVHYLMVNSHPAVLTTWLESLTANDIDTWDWQDCPGFSGTIKAINISMLAQKDDEGTKSFKIVVGSAGTEALSDEFFVSDANPEYYEFSLDTDPATGLAWTQANFNAKQFGIKLIS